MAEGAGITERTGATRTQSPSRRPHQGRDVRVGRPRRYEVDVAEATRLLVAALSLRAVGRKLRVHPSAVSRAVARPGHHHRVPRH